MHSALVQNRVEFVKSFIEHGLILSKFLTHRRLIKLYNDVIFFLFVNDYNLSGLTNKFNTRSRAILIYFCICLNLNEANYYAKSYLSPISCLELKILGK